MNSKSDYLLMLIHLFHKNHKSYICFKIELINKLLPSIVQKQLVERLSCIHHLAIDNNHLVLEKIVNLVSKILF